MSYHLIDMSNPIHALLAGIAVFFASIGTPQLPPYWLDQQLYEASLLLTPVTLKEGSWTVRDAVRAMMIPAHRSFSIVPDVSNATIRIGFRNWPLHVALRAILDPGGADFTIEHGIFMIRPKGG